MSTTDEINDARKFLTRGQQNENYRLRFDEALETFPKPIRVRWKAAGEIFWGHLENSLSQALSLPDWQICHYLFAEHAPSVVSTLLEADVVPFELL